MPTQGRDPRQHHVALDWNRPVQPSFRSVGFEALLGLECVNQALCNPIYSYLFIALELHEVMELFKKQEFSNARRANSSVHLAFLSGTYHTHTGWVLFCVILKNPKVHVVMQIRLFIETTNSYWRSVYSLLYL